MNISIFDASAWGAITRHAKKVAIVGNGEVGPECADEISSADFHIRFNNWSNRKGIDQTHRGNRCDLLVTHFDCLPDNRLDTKAILHAIPPPFQLRRNERLAQRHFPHSKHLMVNPFSQARLCDELDLGMGIPLDGYKHPLPTVGFTLLWHLANVLPVVPSPLSFYVAGFDWHFDPATGAYDRRKPGDVLPRGLNHYFVKEAMWVAKNLVRPEWSFSPKASAALAPLVSAPTPKEKNAPQ